LAPASRISAGILIEVGLLVESCPLLTLAIPNPAYKLVTKPVDSKTPTPKSWRKYLIVLVAVAHPNYRLQSP